MSTSEPENGSDTSDNSGYSKSSDSSGTETKSHDSSEDQSARLAKIDPQGLSELRCLMVETLWWLAATSPFLFPFWLEIVSRSEVYQEELAKALANHSVANLLTFDSREVLGPQLDLLTLTPDAESRSQILKVILSKTTLSDDVDLVRLAIVWLMNILERILRSYVLLPPNRRIMDIYDKIESERDFIYTLEKVCASIKSESVRMKELQQWNERYGDGGSRKRTRDGCVMQPEDDTDVLCWRRTPLSKGQGETQNNKSSRLIGRVLPYTATG
ncbi:hypothetical protein YC2023_031963 [Brassica napus]